MSMCSFYKWICVFILIIGSTGSGFGATNTVACDFLSISNALVTAAEGDTVLVLPGSCVWSNQVTLNSGKSFTFKGSGSNDTTLIAADIRTCLWWQSNSTNLVTISDFNLVGALANFGGWISVGGNAGGLKMKGPTHIYNLQMTNCPARGIVMGYGDSFGLIDHCYIVSRAGGQANPLSFGGNEYSSWTNVNPLGTINQVVVEDCVVENAAGNNGNGHFDAYNGAQFTVRRCTFINSANTGAHGYDSQVTSVRTGEIYNNVFTNIDQSTTIMDWRGGVLLWFSNTVYSKVGVSEVNIRPLLKYYRGCSGAYQSGLGYPGYRTEFRYAGTATGGSSTSLDDTNNNPGPFGTIRSFDEHNGRLIKIVSGTGAGQSATIFDTSNTNFLITGGLFSPAPDNTSGYEIWFIDGSATQVGNQPKYTFKTSITGADNMNRSVLLGSTMAESLSNLYSCVNRDPAGSGVLYAAVTSTITSGRQLDMAAVELTTNSISYENILDGTNAFGWPAAFQHGVLNVTKYSNYPDARFPCYSWSNSLNGANSQLNFRRAFEMSFCNGRNFVTNLLHEGRDYFNNTIPSNYAPLAYPHPLNVAQRGRWGRSPKLISAVPAP